MAIDQQNSLDIIFKKIVFSYFSFVLTMSEDVDYESDVLKFKQIWGDNKNPDQTGMEPKNLTGVDPKNLMTIESNAKKGSKQQQKLQKAQKQKDEQRTTYKKPITSKAQGKRNNQNTNGQTRNPRPDPEHVIQITTRPNQFYTSSFQNQKNNIAQSHLYLDRNASDPFGVTNVNQLKKALQQKDYELSLLRVTNSRTEDRVRYLEKEIQKKNEVIAQMRQRERKVIQKNCDLQSKEFNFDYGKAEYENFKADSRRLLKMLQSTMQYQDFARFALDDDGVRFLHTVNKDIKTRLDNPSTKPGHSIHFCTCNKAFIPESGFWVPEKVYSMGKQFVKNRKGELTQAQLQLLLYELNRLWRERQKRIVNTYTALKAHQVSKYKRKLQDMSRDGRTKSVNRARSGAKDNNNNEE